MPFCKFSAYNGDMNSSPDFIVQLELACSAKAAEIDKGAATRLKDNCSLFFSHFSAIYEMLLNKGVLKPDPYKNDRHLSDLHAPTDHPLTEAEYDDQMPIRMSEYHNTLDFLVNYTQFSIDGLNLKVLKTILAIVKFINWTSLTTGSSSTTTKALATIMDRIRLGTDGVASGVLNSNHSALDKTSRQIQKDLKDIADFKREEYKVALRSKALSHQNQTVHNKDEFVKYVKPLFPKYLPGESFFPELVAELYEDLSTENLETQKTAILERFKVEQVKKKTETPKVNLHGILLEGLRMVGTSSRHLEESITKLEENNQLIKNRPKTLMEKFKEWIVSLSGPKQKETICTVEIIDIVSTMKRTEHIPFESFCQGVSKKARTFASLAAKGSSLYQRYEGGKEEESYEFLNKAFRELREYHEKLDALDLYFKTETPVSERPKLRGIKTELTALKNSVTAVNQKIHEYIARKEEGEQLKKLGISSGHSSPGISSAAPQGGEQA